MPKGISKKLAENPVFSIESAPEPAPTPAAPGASTEPASSGETPKSSQTVQRLAVLAGVGVLVFLLLRKKRQPDPAEERNAGVVYAHEYFGKEATL